MTYLKITAINYFIDLPYILNSNDFNIGTTYEDFLNNKWILLSKEQLEFKKNNPYASIEEIINKKINIIDNSLKIENIRNIKLKNLEIYDKSSSVNEFYLNGEGHWIHLNERIAKSKSLQDEKAIGRIETTIWLDGKGFKMSIDSTIYLLQLLEVYANDCYNITHKHIFNINNLKTVEEINNYDFTKDYPEKLNFKV